MRRICIVILVGVLLGGGLFVGCSGGDDKDPEISSLTASSNSVNVNGTVTLTCVARHPDGLPLEYIWEATAGSISGSGSSVTWIAPNSAGQHIVNCTVVASNGKEDERNISIEVTDEDPPPPPNPYLDTDVSLSANTIVNGRPYCANLYFTPEVGVVVNVSATGPANMDIDLWLYDPNGTQVASGTSWDRGSETIPAFVPTLGGDYRLKVCDWTKIGGTVHVIATRQ